MGTNRSEGNRQEENVQLSTAAPTIYHCLVVHTNNQFFSSFLLIQYYRSFYINLFVFALHFQNVWAKCMGSKLHFPTGGSLLAKFCGENFHEIHPAIIHRLSISILLWYILWYCNGKEEPPNALYRGSPLSFLSLVDQRPSTSFGLR